MNFLNYEVISELHSGTEFTTYKATDLTSREIVTLKVTNQKYPDPHSIQKIENELKFGTKLNNENLIKYINLADLSGQKVLVKEYFEGDTLSIVKEKIDKKYPKGEKNFILLSIAKKLAEALEAVHNKKIIYKNLSPQNILFDLQKNKLNIINFSKADYLNNENSLKKNHDFSLDFLTYISPELTRRINLLPDYRSDLYSVGVILFELFNDTVPFIGNDPMEIIYGHLAKNIPEQNENIPAIINKIIAKLLKKNPSERYETATGLKFDLGICLENIENLSTLNFELAKNDFSNKFLISEKLYGRDKEVNLLLETFKNIQNEGSEIALISGEPGIGKSSLVREIKQKTLLENSYFISGKFEQLQNDIPYSAIIDALRDFINQILLESTDKLEIWKQKILEAVGINGTILSNIIPELSLIIGEQPEPSILGASETHNRFNLVVKNFIECISASGNPLIMFIDDWQWADSASLNFIKLISEENENGSLFIVGAYRDNDPDLIKPIISLIEEFKERGIVKLTLHLGNLEEKDINSLFLDSIKNNSNKNSADLSKYILEKTDGNPFFVKQFLKSLYRNREISFNDKTRKWTWEIESINKLPITDNVVDFLIGKIKNLNPETNKELMYGACLGQNFNLKMLSKLQNGNNPNTINILQPAVDLGLINVLEVPDDIDKGGIEFRFVHDKVEQAVYSIISENEIRNMHLKIGHLLKNIDNYSNDPAKLFEIVRHLNNAKELITDDSEIKLLINLNIQAGIEAKKSVAYKSAYNYFFFALNLIDEEYWEKDYDLTLNLYINLVETASLTNKFDTMDNYMTTILTKAKKNSDKLPVYKIKIQAYQAQAKLAEALEAYLEGLSVAGIDIPTNPTQDDIAKAAENLMALISKVEINDLINLSPITNIDILKAMELMISGTSILYKAAPALSPIIIYKMVELSLEYGNTPFSPAIYTTYAYILCTFLNDPSIDEDVLEEYITLGHGLGTISSELVENPEMKPFKVLVVEYFNFCCRHWKEHIRASIQPLADGYWSGVENGNFEFAGYCVGARPRHLIFAGISLEDIVEEGYTDIDKINKINQKPALNWELMSIQFAHNLLGKNEEVTELCGEFFDEHTMFEPIKNMGDMVAMSYFYINKMMLNYYFGDYQKADMDSIEAEKNIPGIAGLVDNATFFFFDSLIKLKLYEAANNEQKVKLLEKIVDNKQKLKTYSRFAPMNYLQKYCIIEAEVQAINGNNESVQRNFEKAIELSKEYEFINDEALAYELLANFYLNINNIDEAKRNMKEAHYKYQLWGASKKAQQLKNKYSNFFSKEIIFNQESSDYIDISAILKSTQAISREVNLKQLIKKLIKILLEVSGAQKLIIFRKAEDNFFCEAFVDKEENRHEVLTALPAEDLHSYPRSALFYSGRTRSTLFYPQDINKVALEKDKYITSKEHLSFIITPIELNNEITGVIYLENNLINSSFNQSIINVVEILASQAAISIDNALLYDRLEEEVKKRTKELEITNAELMIQKEVAESANKAKTNFLTGVSHEIRTPMNSILGFTEMLKDQLKDPKLKHYAYAAHSSGEVLLDLINDILDLSNIESNKIEYNKNAVSLERIIESIELMLENKIKIRKLDFRKSISNKLPKYLLLDGTRIKQILINLICNSFKFTQEGFIELIIDFEKAENLDNGTLKISVLDSGMGVPKDKMKTIFQPFVQLKAINTNSESGTGLGLFISSKLAEGMNGHIEVESQEGVGSKFIVTFNNVEIIESNKLSTDFNDNIVLDNVIFERKKVIVADDISNNREMLIEYLKPHNLDILEASNGKEIFDLVEKNPNTISLILLDMKMPEMDGYEVISKLKNDTHKNKIPVIGITASALKKDEENLDMICDSYFFKPVKKQKLILEVMKYIPVKKEEESAKNTLEASLIVFKRDFPELVNKLVNEKSLINRLLKTMSISEIEDYAKTISRTGRVFESSYMENLGINLYEETQNYNIRNIREILTNILKI